jgi:phosphatidylserine/phosphatidylglycerophosphate/cardiolipin synthase-like enzyme
MKSEAATGHLSRHHILSFHNWTNAGAYDNDENMLIIHDRELARAYYAEWQRLWETVPVERVCNGFEVCLPVVVRERASPLTTPPICGRMGVLQSISASLWPSLLFLTAHTIVVL